MFKNKKIMIILLLLLITIISLIFCIKFRSEKGTFKEIILDKYNADNYYDITLYLNGKNYYSTTEENINKIIEYLSNLNLIKDSNLKMNEDMAYIDISGYNYSVQNNSSNTTHISFFIAVNGIKLINDTAINKYALESGEIDLDYIINLLNNK